MTAAPAKKAASKGAKRKRAPQLEAVEQGLPAPERVDLPAPDELEEQAKSPYPDGVQVFTYQPKSGDEPILLPLSGFGIPDKVWHWDIAQLPLLAQTWAWMRKANVPKEIQRQCQFLPDPEYFDMFDAWFDAMQAQKAPKGAVTVGK